MAWISGNRYLTMTEMQNNVDIIHYYFITKGWTENAIAGMPYPICISYVLPSTF